MGVHFSLDMGVIFQIFNSHGINTYICYAMSPKYAIKSLNFKLHVPCSSAYKNFTNVFTKIVMWNTSKIYEVNVIVGIVVKHLHEI